MIALPPVDPADFIMKSGDELQKCINKYFNEIPLEEAARPEILDPKYTPDQDRYYGWVEGGAKGVGAIMTTAAKNPEATGAALEALCCYSYDGVIPVYYEINLKMKYSRDEITTQMFDIIRESRTYDLGDNIWCTIIRDVFNKPLYNQTPLASAIASQEKSINKTIADTVEQLKNNS